MRIKYIIPFPFDDEGLANRAAQIPKAFLSPDTAVECVPVRNSAIVDCTTRTWSSACTSPVAPRRGRRLTR
jgi:hypothetical protein